MGGVYWYLYLTGEASVSISFNIGAEASALEGAAGPLKLSGRDPSELNGSVVDREKSAEKGSNINLDHSVSLNHYPTPGSLMSGVAQDLGDDSQYAKTHKERMDAASPARSSEKV